MSINKWEVYIKCPVCGEITTVYDYHENTSSDNTEIFCVLNIGKESNHLWLGNPMTEVCFICSFCKSKTPYNQIFTKNNCNVENLDRYKVSLWSHICWADKNGKVSFSDWNSDWGEEPALSRLISMYPEDTELLQIKEAYRVLHSLGKQAVTKFETNAEVVSRSLILAPNALERVYLGNNVKMISANTFANCGALSDIYIPDSVTKIGDYAFAESNLNKIHVSKKLTSIGKRAFYHTYISKFFFPDNIETIGEECFMECPYLNNIWLPPSVIVGQNAFAKCDGLRHIQIAESISQETVNTWGLSEMCSVERYKVIACVI